MRTLRILYAEDEILIALCVTDALQERGHSVSHYVTGDMASDALAEDTFDVLLTDLRMPGSVDGLELIDRARQAMPGLPVVLISGTPPQDMHRDSLTEVLEKPCRLDEVVVAVERVAETVMA